MRLKTLLMMVETLHATSLHVEDAPDSAVIFINFPFLRIVVYIGSYSGQGLLIPDDVVIESRLPGESSDSCTTDSFRRN